MDPVALVTLLQFALAAGTQIAQTIQQMQADGRSQTTAEETAALQAALSKLGVDEAAFEQQFGINPAGQ